MKKWLTRFFNLEEQELPPILGFWLFYGAIVMMLQMGETLSMSLFIKRVGVEYLPILYIIVALINAVLTTAYTFVSDRMSNRSIFIAILLLTGLGFLVSYLLAGIYENASYYMFFVFRESAFTLLIMHFGLYVRDFYSRQDSERTFPVIYASGRIGGILSGIFLSFASVQVGALELTWAYTVLAFVCIAMLFLVEKILPPKHQAVTTETDKKNVFSLTQGWQNFTEGLAYVIQSKLLMAMSMATLLFVVLRYFLNFQYSHIFNEIFPTEEALTQFLANYSVVALSIAAIIQTSVTSRLIKKIGLASINQLFSVAMTLSFASLLILPGFYSALFSRFVETELRMSFRNPVMNLFYNAVPDAQRARSRAFTFGFVLPTATLLAGALLQCVGKQWTTQEMAIIGLMLGLLFIYFTWQQGKAYNADLKEIESA